MAAWIIESGFVGFGGNKTESKPNDYLPFKIVDTNSEAERLKRSISPQTIAIFKELVETRQIPSHIVRDFYRIEEFHQLLA